MHRIAVCLLALLLPGPLTGCSGLHLIANDPQGECRHPDKPSQPLTDKKVALFIVNQSQAIDTCRALLGDK